MRHQRATAAHRRQRDSRLGTLQWLYMAHWTLLIACTLVAPPRHQQSSTAPRGHEQTTSTSTSTRAPGTRNSAIRHACPMFAQNAAAAHVRSVRDRADRDVRQSLGRAEPSPVPWTRARRQCTLSDSSGECQRVGARATAVRLSWRSPPSSTPCSPPPRQAAPCRRAHPSPFASRRRSSAARAQSPMARRPRARAPEA